MNDDNKVKITEAGGIELIDAYKGKQREFEDLKKRVNVLGVVRMPADVPTLSEALDLWEASEGMVAEITVSEGRFCVSETEKYGCLTIVLRPFPLRIKGVGANKTILTGRVKIEQIQDDNDETFVDKSENGRGIYFDDLSVNSKVGNALTVRTHGIRATQCSFRSSTGHGIAIRAKHAVLSLVNCASMENTYDGLRVYDGVVHIFGKSSNFSENGRNGIGITGNDGYVYLHVPNDDTFNETNICNTLGGDKIKWLGHDQCPITKTELAFFYIRSKLPGGRALDIAHGGPKESSKIQLHNFNGSGAQEWVWEADGTLMNPQTGKVLDVDGQYDEDNMWQKISLTTRDPLKKQGWKKEQNEDTIIHIDSGRALDVRGNEQTNGTEIGCFEEHKQLNQQWELRPSSYECRLNTFFSLFDPSRYLVVRDKLTFAEHEERAKQMGAEIVSITCDQENSLVFDLITDQGRLAASTTTEYNYYIGGKRRHPDGSPNGPGPLHWEWSDGKTDWTYTNWAPGEPNNKKKDNAEEDRVEMLVGKAYYAENRDNMWNDISGKEKRGAVYKFAYAKDRMDLEKEEAERAFEDRRDPSRYRLEPDRLTYAEHETRARLLGAELVSITCKSENAYVHGLFDSERLKDKTVYIGGKRHDRSIPLYLPRNGPCAFHWGWSDCNTSWKYTNWRKNEPNNANNNEDRVEMLSDGTWNDINHTLKRAAIYKFPPVNVNGQWTLPNSDHSSTVVTIRNSQFVPSECHGGHWNCCRYFVDSLYKNKDRRVLKVIGGEGSSWSSSYHQMWYLQDNFEMHVISSTKTHVSHKWTPMDVVRPFKEGQPSFSYGILHFLATCGGTIPYKNPHLLNIGVKARSSSLAIRSGTEKEYIVYRWMDSNRSWFNCMTKDEEGSWFAVDFGERRRVQPTHYSLKQLQYAHHSLQSWVLEGSAEDNDAPADDGWMVLSEINDDTTLSTEHGYESTWPVEMQAATVATGFRHFRIRQTGTNKAGTFELSLTGFELYGSMTTKST